MTFGLTILLPMSLLAVLMLDSMHCHLNSICRQALRLHLLGLFLSHS